MSEQSIEKLTQKPPSGWRGKVISMLLAERASIDAALKVLAPVKRGRPAKQK